MPVSNDAVLAALVRVVQGINADDESKEDRATLDEFLKQYLATHKEVKSGSKTSRQ